jgi:hypothetical protein
VAKLARLFFQLAEAHNFVWRLVGAHQGDERTAPGRVQQVAEDFPCLILWL